MIKAFFTVLNMSLSASVVILAVVLIRLFLKRVPKVFSYVLWIAVFFRLLCPILPEANWGVVPYFKLMEVGAGTGLWVLGDSGQPAEGFRLMYETYMEDRRAIERQKTENNIDDENVIWTDMETVEKDISLKNISDIMFKIKKVYTNISIIWLVGCLGLSAYGIFSYSIFMKKLKVRGNQEGENDNIEKRFVSEKNCVIVLSGKIKEPFVTGIFRPVIYIPEGLDKQQQELVTWHEMVHIMRLDYLMKPIAYLAVCIHWFNPLVWLAFHFMEQDMEASCDEAVLKKIGYDNKKAYADTLLCLSEEQEWRENRPIGFGEKSVKSRIKNVIKLKETKIWSTVIAAIGVFGVAVLILVNGKENLSAAEEIVRDNPVAVPGTDSNYETEYIYDETASSTSGMFAEEKIYLPAEKIEHYYIPDGNVREEEVEKSYLPAEKIEHYYIPDGNVREEEVERSYLPAEKIEHVETGGGDMVTEHYYIAADPTDGYFVLLRQSQDAYQEKPINYICPTEFTRISDKYGLRTHPATQEKILHSGVDFAAETGTPVHAAAEGTIFETGQDVYCGNYVIIQHDNGEMTYYANCDQILVEAGQKVVQGEQVATVGNTGASTGSHLHFAVSRNGNYIEPVWQ